MNCQLLGAMDVASQRASSSGAGVSTASYASTTSEQRRYLQAFEQWFKAPTEENLKIKRRALQEMMLAASSDWSPAHPS